MTEISSDTLFYVNIVRITVFCCSHFLFYFEILPLCFSSCFLVPPACFFQFLPSPLLSPPHLHLFLILSSLYYLMYSSVCSVLVRLLPLLCPCSPVSLLHPPPCSFSVHRDSTLCSPSVSPRVSHWYVS